MSCYTATSIYQTSYFRLPAENVDAAIKAIEGLEWRGEWRWCYAPKSYTNFASIMSSFGWTAETSSDGTVYDIYTDGEIAMGGEETLFSAIAPYVEVNSHIDMLGADGKQWQWFFDGEKCIERDATITYNVEPTSSLVFDIVIRYSEIEPESFSIFHFILPDNDATRELRRRYGHNMVMVHARDTIDNAVRALMLEDDELDRFTAAEKAAHRYAERFGGTVTEDPYETIII